MGYRARRCGPPDCPLGPSSPLSRFPSSSSPAVAPLRSRHRGRPRRVPARRATPGRARPRPPLRAPRRRRPRPLPMQANSRGQSSGARRRRLRRPTCPRRAREGPSPVGARALREGHPGHRPGPPRRGAGLLRPGPADPPRSDDEGKPRREVDDRPDREGDRDRGRRLSQRHPRPGDRQVRHGRHQGDSLRGEREGVRDARALSLQLQPAQLPPRRPQNPN